MRRLGLVAIATLAGCSFAFVDGPPKILEARPRCTEDKTIPAIDGILGAAHVVGAITAATLTDVDDGNTMTTIAILDGIFAFGHLLAALAGSSDVDKCRAAIVRWDSGR